MLPRCYRYAFEFRHESWYEDDILDLLRDHDISLCLSDHHDAPSPWEVTARHVYVRGHGPGGRYKDNYPDKTLRAWARDIRKWKRQRRTVFVYFDNDQKSAAPKDAKRLMELMARTAAVTAARPAQSPAAGSLALRLRLVDDLDQRAQHLRHAGAARAPRARAASSWRRA